MARINWNDDWVFNEKYSEEFLKEDECDNNIKIRIPHSVKETPFHYFSEKEYEMVSGYKKKLFVEEKWRNKRIYITFEGVAHKSEVYINDKKVGEHKCGYTGFTIELTDYVNYNENNTIIVKVDSRESLNIPPFGHVIDYMTYGGIYREVYIDIKEKCNIKDVFLYSDFKDEKWHLCSEINISEADKKYEKYEICYFISKKGEDNYRPLGDKKTDEKFIKNYLPVSDVNKWDIESPNLYDIKVELYGINEDNKKEFLDKKIISFGFRTAVFKKDGFYLNGKKVKIRGLNRHQSYAYVGYAMPESMQKLDAELLKCELGLNAVRTSHYPQSHHFIDKCDELGLLVFTEIPGWQYIGDSEWKKVALDNVVDMVRQYRNHPSIILWGVRINESNDDELYRETNEVCRKNDPSRQTGGVRCFKKSKLYEDVYTYNDFLHDGVSGGCEKKSKVTSDINKPYLVTEYNGHMYPTKSFDTERIRLNHALRHARVLDDISAKDDIAGSFGWCMFDYNTHKDFGSGDRICYHGVMDMFRNPKMAAYVYDAMQEEKPVLEYSSLMDIGERPACIRGKNYLFTNADSVLMYRNDVLIREYTKSDTPYRHMINGPIEINDYVGDRIDKEETWCKGKKQAVKKLLNSIAINGANRFPKALYPDIVKLYVLYHMRPGDIYGLYNKYVGDWGGNSTSYKFEAKKDGKIVKTIIKEPVEKINLQVECDHNILQEKATYDVALVRIRAVDQNGNILPFFNEPITLKSTGNIKIIGPHILTLSGGMAGTYVKTVEKTGKGILEIVNEQAGKATVEFTIKK